jgi:hypothetical protein
MAMDNTWLRLLIGSGIVIALLSLGALEHVSSRIPVDQTLRAVTTLSK